MFTNKNKKIIYILGIDGSGKTTLSKTLTQYFKVKNLKVEYIYARHFPILLMPFKIIGKKAVLKNLDEFNQYDAYKKRKNHFFLKYRFLSYIYCFLWLTDYTIVTWLRVLPKYIFNNFIIIDRYFLDTIVNLSESIMLNDNEMLTLSNILKLFFPKPTMYLFLKVSPEIAFNRKSDIQSLSYLIERIRRYNSLSKEYNFIEINGELEQDIVLSSTIEIIKNKLNYEKK